MLDEDRTTRWEPADLRSADQPTAPYLEAVVAYATRGSTRFHVPGHKGGAGADPGLRAALGWAALGALITAVSPGGTWIVASQLWRMPGESWVGIQLRFSIDWP